MYNYVCMHRVKFDLHEKYWFNYNAQKNMLYTCIYTKIIKPYILGVDSRHADV